MRVRALALGVVAAVLVAGCTVQGPPPDPPPASVTPTAVTPAPGTSSSGTSAVVTPASDRSLDTRIDAFLDASRSGRYDHVAEVLVLVGGRTVVEKHRRGPADVRREIDGVTAAVLATLVGIAIDRGALRDVRQGLAELLPDVPPDLASATLHEVLVGTTAARADVLAAVLVRATGVAVPDLAREALFVPLGIDPVWTAGGGLAVTAREMAALGQLWRDRGQMNGRQVVSASWVDLAARPYARTGQRLLPYAGYRQWVARAGGHAATVVTGHGGQLVEVVPALDLVVVVACDDIVNPLKAETAGSNAFAELVDSVVVPALR